LGPDVSIFLRKSPEWSYEDEWSLIKPWNELTKGEKTREGKTREAHYQVMPMEAVRAVYLGVRISEDHKVEILTSLKMHPHIKRYVMRRHDTEFGLVPEEISP
jgi:hypothetical protein